MRLVVAAAMSLAVISSQPAGAGYIEVDRRFFSFPCHDDVGHSDCSIAIFTFPTFPEAAAASGIVASLEAVLFTLHIERSSLTVMARGSDVGFDEARLSAMVVFPFVIKAGFAQVATLRSRYEVEAVCSPSPPPCNQTVIDMANRDDAAFAPAPSLFMTFDPVVNTALSV